MIKVALLLALAAISSATQIFQKDIHINGIYGDSPMSGLVPLYEQGSSVYGSKFLPWSAAQYGGRATKYAGIWNSLNLGQVYPSSYSGQQQEGINSPLVYPGVSPLVAQDVIKQQGLSAAISSGIYASSPLLKSLVGDRLAYPWSQVSGQGVKGLIGQQGLGIGASVVPQVSGVYGMSSPWVSQVSAGPWAAQGVLAGPWAMQGVSGGKWGSQGVSSGPWASKRSSAGPWTSQGVYSGPWASQGLSSGEWDSQGFSSVPWVSQGLSYGPWASQGLSYGPWASQGSSYGPWASQRSSYGPWASQGLSYGPWASQGPFSTPWGSQGPYSAPWVGLSSQWSGPWAKSGSWSAPWSVPSYQQRQWAGLY